MGFNIFRIFITKAILTFILLFLFVASSTVKAKEIFVKPPPDQWESPIKDNRIYGFFLLDQFEYRVNEDKDTLRWDAQGWLGKDYNKLWIKTEGDQRLSGDHGGDVEFQLLYSHLISPFFYFQAGGRFDKVYGEASDPSRFFGVLSLEGLVPYRFDVEPAIFISDNGDISARLEAEYDLLITQRLIVQPRFEINAAIQKVEKFGVGSGLNDVEADLRLRYEIRREFAPYIGVAWTRLLGETADLARENDETVDNLAFVLGLRVWFY